MHFKDLNSPKVDKILHNLRKLKMLLKFQNTFKRLFE